LDAPHIEEETAEKETENLTYKVRNIRARYDRTVSASNVVPFAEEDKDNKSWFTVKEEDKEQSKEENEEGEEHEFEKKNEEKWKKHNLRHTVRDEKRLFGKYGSLEDVLPPQKENYDDRESYEDDIEEDITPTLWEAHEEETEEDVMPIPTEYLKDDIEEEAIPPENNTEEPLKYGENADKEHVIARDIQPKRYRKIKYKQIGMLNGKHKDKMWIKTKDNTNVCDINMELESWKYAEVVFAKGAKQEDDGKEIRKEKVQLEQHIHNINSYERAWKRGHRER